MLQYIDIAIMKHLGEGYGYAQEAIKSTKDITRAIERIGGNFDLVKRCSFDTGYCDPDWDYNPCGTIGHQKEEITVKNLLENLWHHKYGTETVNNINSLIDLEVALCDVLAEQDVKLDSLLTVEKDEKRHQELTRERL